MSTLVFTDDARLSSFADHALDAAARIWFAVAVGGQLLLAAYVAWFYGGTALQGRMEAWSAVLTRGYIRGDAAGNTAIILHLVAAVILVAGGALQFMPQVRERAPRFHRWMGVLYLLMAVAGSLTGLYLTWIRGTRGDLAQHIGGSVNALLILTCVFFSLRTVIQRRFAVHRRWVLRLFLAVSAAWFYRVGLFFWLLLNGGDAVGFDLATWRGPALTIISFANSLVPLAVLELYLHARTRAGAHGRLAMAAALIALTVVMSIGIAGATVGMWLPIVQTGQLKF